MSTESKDFGMADLKPTSWGWGRTKREEYEVLAQRSFPWYIVYILVAGWPALLLFKIFGLNLSFWTLVVYLVLAVIGALPIFAGSLFLHSRLVAAKNPGNPGKYLTFKDKSFEAEWKGKKVPILELYNAYIASKLDIAGDLLTSLYDRYEFADFIFTQGHVTYFLGKLIPELIVHSKHQDSDQVTEHYDRGNDFYSWFLGEETMCYTSGIFNSPEDTLDQAQYNKIHLVARKIHLQKGDEHLDIGCGWGTLIKVFARDYGTNSTGVTLAKEQVKWATDQIAKAGVQDRARALVMDYRDIPARKYNKITCLEMAEHVGVRLFSTFLNQVYDLLEDDGIFYLQIAGLRRAWQYEDLMWGCFMGNYVFPGADASCPLGWVVDKLEGTGWEVRSVETIGIHYSATIKRWYDNWVSNKPKIIKKYGEEWYRKWAFFLAWSVISPEQGSATCYQLVLHKNTRNFNRKMFVGEKPLSITANK